MRQIEVIDSQRMKIMDKLRFHNIIVDALSRRCSDICTVKYHANKLRICVTHFFIDIFVDRLHRKDNLRLVFLTKSIVLVYR